MNIKTIMPFVVLMTVMAGCRDTHDEAVAPEQDDRIHITLTLTVSDDRGTRADGSAPQRANQVENALVLLFRTDAEGRASTLYDAVGTDRLELVEENIATGRTVYSFEAELGVDAATPPHLQAVVLANAYDEATKTKVLAMKERTATESTPAVTGSTYADVAAAMTAEATPGDGGNPVQPLFTCWGICDRLIDTSLKVNQLRVGLLRDHARVDVTVDVNVPATTFQLTDVCVAKVSDRIALMPGYDNRTIDPEDKLTMKVNAITLPDGTHTSDSDTVDPGKWGAVTDCAWHWSGVVENNAVVGKVFVPECDVRYGDADANVNDANRLKRAAVIVGGKYNGSDRVTYYRVDFAIKNEPVADGEDPVYDLVDVMRNHCYKINVTDVRGPGEETPQKAYETVAARIEATVNAWEDVNVDVTFDGDNWVSIPRMVTFGAKAGSIVEVPFSSNVKPENWQTAWGKPGDEFPTALNVIEKDRTFTLADADGLFEMAVTTDGKLSIRSLKDLADEAEVRKAQLFIAITPRLRVVVDVVQSMRAGDGLVDDWDAWDIHGTLL